MCIAANLGLATEVVWSVANLKFTTEIELFAANSHSLSNCVL